LFCKNPIANEPGLSIKHHDCESYNTIIFYSNIKTAICEIIQQKEGVVLPWFSMFMPFVKETFLINYNAILNSLEELKNKPPMRIETDIYCMKIPIDYSNLYKQLQNIHLEPKPYIL